VLAQLLPELGRLGRGVVRGLGRRHEREVEPHEIDDLAAGADGARLEAPAPAPHLLGRRERNPLDP